MRPGFGPMAEAASLQRVGFDQIHGWNDDRHEEALAAFRRSAAVMPAQFERQANRFPAFAGQWSDWRSVCEKSMAAPDALAFFETEFVPFRVRDASRPQGLFTGYYEPLANGRRSRGNGFEVPVYAKPPDLESFSIEIEKARGFRYGRRQDGRPKPYFTRREIEQGALAGQGLEIVWLESGVDAFFIHIQGSGRVLLDDGASLRLAYAAKSGRPYTAIGGLLVERGEIAQEAMSMQAIRQWMASRPEAARQLMWRNESFVFFRAVVIEDPSLGAPGAQGVNLTPLRSLAVDREIWPFGMPVWLDLLAPAGPRAELRPFRSLLIAQDTGSAIKGPARADVYWGWGETAALTAGHMASPGDMIVLLPAPLASRLASSP